MIPAAILTADACADLLGCSVDQIETLARQGDLPGTKPGRSWLFVAGDVIGYISERAQREAQERRAARAPKPAGQALPEKRGRRKMPAI